MTIGKIVLVGLVACAGGGTLWLGDAVARLRKSNEMLRLERQEMEALAANPAADTSAVPATNSGSFELLELRNEVSRLRAQQPALGRLRAENERLRSELASRPGAKPDIVQMEGYLSKESWANVGLATPEAALQTTLWAIRQGDLAQVAECMEPRYGDTLRQALRRIHERDLPEEEERARILEEWAPLIQPAGVRITERVAQDDNRVTLKIQAVAGGATIPMGFRRYGNEWRMNF